MGLQIQRLQQVVEKAKYCIYFIQVKRAAVCNHVKELSSEELWEYICEQYSLDSCMYCCNMGLLRLSNLANMLYVGKYVIFLPHCDGGVDFLW